MKAIFYDLETTDKNPIGQILNYCFILADERFNPLRKLSGLIRISRLQLPAPESILANRVDVVEHQRAALDTEPEALRRISNFLEEATECRRTAVALIGYNSSKFDLPYLRTSFIRNGFNPYFGGKLIARDMLLAARKLAVSHPQFPRFCHPGEEQGENPRLSLRLENLAVRLGLLEGKQAHNSEDDVQLTIELAKLFKARFNLDPVTYEPYEAAPLQAKAERPLCCFQFTPNYDLKSADPVCRAPVALLNSKSRCSLWVDLDRYKAGEGRRSICWFNHNTSGFILGGVIPAGDEYYRTAERALEEFQDITVDNFFPPSSCDVEQDIYRLRMDSIERLEAAIKNPAPLGRKNFSEEDMWQLYMRYRLAYGSWEPASGAAAARSAAELAERHFKAYAMYRYGGRLQLSKTPPEEGCAAEGRQYYHPSFHEYWGQLDQLSSRGGQDSALLKSLKVFYLNSDIYRLAGEGLLKASAAQAEAVPEA